MRKEYDTVGTPNQKNKNKQDDETEIDLGKLFKALVQRLPIILLVTLCFSALAFPTASIISRWSTPPALTCM